MSPRSHILSSPLSMSCFCSLGVGSSASFLLAAGMVRAFGAMVPIGTIHYIVPYVTSYMHNVRRDIIDIFRCVIAIIYANFSIGNSLDK